MSDRPMCVYSARLLWQRGQWVLSWHRKRIGRSPLWLMWPQLRRSIVSHVLLKPPAEVDR